MAGVTDQGWEPKTLQDILDSVSDKAKQEWGEDFPTTPDSVFGQLANIIGADVKDLWDMGEEVEDTQNRDSATGLYLDYLAALVGLTRQEARGATGDVLFTGQVDTTVFINTACKSQDGKVVLTTEENTLNRSNCFESTFSVNSLQDNTDYTIFVEGIENTMNSGVGSSAIVILNSLKALIDANNTTINLVNEDEETLTITYQSANNELTTTNSNNLTLDSVASLVPAESAETGKVNLEANTITNLITPNLGISSINNPDAFESGRDLETDPELRLRMTQREQSTGTATKPSIEASVAEIAGVTSVYVEVNDTLNDDSVTGVPAKSFETFVSGGSSNTIAEVLWKTKPLFGQTFGDVEELIIDDNGDTQSIKFSRPTEKFAWVRVTYTVNDEEAFAPDGEERMKKVVTDYGNNMYQGEDFEPTKFYGPLYTVQGVYINEIEIAITGDEITPPAYQTARIPISKTTTLSFDESRVPITT